MTSRFIGSGPSDLSSRPSKGQSGVLQVTDRSSTRIPSSRITGRHPRPTGSPIGVGSTEVQLAYSYSPSPQGAFPRDICPNVNVIALLEFELAYYDSSFQRFNHYSIKTPLFQPKFHNVYWEYRR